MSFPAPEKIKELSKRTRVVKNSKYDGMEAYFDGNPYLLSKGTHFDCTVGSFSQTLRRKASERGLKVEIRLRGDDALEFQTQEEA